MDRLFPRPGEQLTINQQLVRREYERLMNMSTAFGIQFPEPRLPNLEGYAFEEDFELTDFSHELNGDGFVLDLGIACWDGDGDMGAPVVGLAIRFGENGNRIEVSFDPVKGWKAELVLEDVETMDPAPIRALARSLDIMEDTDVEQAEITEKTALRLVERMYLHYLANRPRI